MSEPISAAPLAADYVVAKKKAASAGFILRKIIWTVAFLAMIMFGANGFISFALQSGAPQQAAASAYACFQMITVYVIARALDELTRPERLSLQQ
jgi:hypothetical protein